MSSSLPYKNSRPMQQYYSPLSRRHNFSPEHLVDTAVSLKRTKFGADLGFPKAVVLTRAPPVLLGLGSIDDQLISKPNGEVTRLDRGGYNLLKATKWEESFFEEVQVHAPTSMFIMSFIIFYHSSVCMSWRRSTLKGTTASTNRTMPD